MTAVSPSGYVVLDATGRRARIVKSTRGTCTWCGEPVKKPRQTWCSQECVDRYQLTQPDVQRRSVENRDKGVCALCGLDTWRLARIFRKCSSRQARQRAGRVVELILKLVLPKHRYSFWDMDHEVPISEGGDPFALENLRTLCYWCHQRETAKGAARRAHGRQRPRTRP